jgi:hypothetical protein
VAVAALLSVGLPGAGHIFLGRRVLGVALYRLWLAFMSVIAGDAPPLSLLRTCLPWALLLAVYSLASGAFTWVVSRRRLVPAARESRKP